MAKKYTKEELQNLDHKARIQILLGMQNQLDTVNNNYKKLIEQIRMPMSTIMEKTEKKGTLNDQMAFAFKDGDVFYFNEAEALVGNTKPKSSTGRSSSEEKKEENSSCRTAEGYPWE